MKKPFEIKVPKETVNDDVVTITSWFVSHGDQISKGDLLVEVETSKAAIEIEAEEEGIIEIIYPDESSIEIGVVIGRILDINAVIESDPEGCNYSNKNEKEESSIELNEEIVISNKAKLLIDKYAIDKSVFSNLNFVKESDVQNYIKNQEFVEKPIKETIANEVDKEVSNEIRNEVSRKNKQSIWSDAKKSSKDRGKNVVWLVLNYIFRNWLLNGLVRWAPYGIIIWVHRLRGVKIGKNCFIDPSAIIETAHPGNIVIGNDVRIAAQAVVMTHIKAPNHLREKGLVPFVLKPVVLEDHCFIGVNAILMPGVTVGKGAVVASGAVITSNVPSYSMVSGNPAKVIKNFTLS